VDNIDDMFTLDIFTEAAYVTKLPELWAKLNRTKFTKEELDKFNEIQDRLVKENKKVTKHWGTIMNPVTVKSAMITDHAIMRILKDRDISEDNLIEYLSTANFMFYQGYSDEHDNHQCMFISRTGSVTLGLSEISDNTTGVLITAWGDEYEQRLAIILYEVIKWLSQK